MNNDIELYVDNLPEEAVDDVYEFYYDLKKVFLGQSVNEYSIIELNYKVNAFEHLLRTKYDDNRIICKLNGEMAYHNTLLSVDELCRLHKEYCPKTHKIKEEYTRLEVNNMLFDLSVVDVVKGYECVALPYSFADKHNNEIFDSVVRVKCRY